MNEEEYLNKIIKECRWKKDVGGIPICVGECTPCYRVIDNGKCDTLIEYSKTKKPGYIYDSEEEN